jgi:Transposase and inactivated derivatives
MRKPYSTNLHYDEWAILAPLIPGPKPDGRPRGHDMREILNAIFYFLLAGCLWRMLPHGFPPCSTLHWYFRTWRRS